MSYDTYINVARGVTVEILYPEDDPVNASRAYLSVPAPVKTFVFDELNVQWVAVIVCADDIQFAVPEMMTQLFK